MKIAQFLLVCFLVVVSYSIKAQQPPPPVLRGVSVDFGTNNGVWVHWSQEEGNYYIRAFKIYRVNDSGINELMETVNRDMRVWVDQNAPSDIRRCIYSVSLLWSIEPLGPTQETATSEEIYQTIHLKPDIDHILCAHTNTIRFTEYHITGNASSYIIWAETDPATGMWPIDTIQTSDLEIVGTELTGGANIPITATTNVYAYHHTGVDPDKTYSYFIEAVSDNYPNPRAISNTVSYTTPPDPQPQPPSINSVSVNDDGSVSINANIPDVYLCSDAYLKRRIEPSETPVELQLNFPESSPQLLDDDVATSADAYYYEVFSKNNCADEINGVGEHRTILLNGSINDNSNVNLNWNHYVGWAVNDYEIWRKQGEEEWERIERLGASVTTYSDDLNSLPSKEIALKYRINAVGEDYNSNSNILQLQLDYTPILPNAFNPLSTESKNTTFKPISDFYNSVGYRFQIFDRWGGLLWETEEPKYGWDGRANGKLQQRGAYVYLLRYKDQAGLEYTLSNTVMLFY
ncbi:MAG: hypothetical protein FD155_2782 [Bacteroidetes bacterium]|nr:MAG: hypothetical protein FD155_2782 [Bacteroidota bacterium]